MDIAPSPDHRALRLRQLAALIIIAISLIVPSLTLARRPAAARPSGAAPSGLPIVQQAYVKASNTGDQDWFGSGVAISGDTVVIGADAEWSNSPGVNGNQQDNSIFGAGAAYVFVRTETGWVQQAYLKASNPGAEDHFGTSVAISGDTIVVGAPREDGGASGVNGVQNNDAHDAGAAYVFVRNGTTWSQQAYLKAATPDGGDQFGWDVAIDGATIVVGAYLDDSDATGVNGNPANANLTNSGAAYVFARAGTVWSQQAYLKASNTDSSDEFGWSVTVDDDTIVVGSARESSGGVGVNGNQHGNFSYYSGAAYVFARAGTTWSQQAYLKAASPDEGDHFGLDVALAGDTIVVGAPEEDGGATVVNGNQQDNGVLTAGAAYVFVRSGAAWSQQAYLKHPNTQIEDRIGWSVAIVDDMILAGGPSADSQGKEASGAAYVFTRSGATWSHQASLMASNPGVSHWFGNAVAAAPDLLVVAAKRESSAATGINGNQLDTSLMSAGAAYFFADTNGIPLTSIPTHLPATRTALAEVTPSTATATASWPTHLPATQTAFVQTDTPEPTHLSATQTVPAEMTPTATATQGPWPTHLPATQTSMAITPSAPPAGTAIPATAVPTGTATIRDLPYKYYFPVIPIGTDRAR